jgi:hypothetical protein
MHSRNHAGKRSREPLTEKQVICRRKHVQCYLTKQHLPPFGELCVYYTDYYYEYAKYLPYQFGRGHTVKPFYNHTNVLINIVAPILSQNAWFVNKIIYPEYCASKKIAPTLLPVILGVTLKVRTKSF